MVKIRIIALSLILAGFSAWASSIPSVDKARGLLQKRNRLGATELLVQELKREKNPIRLQELQRELDKMANMFLTNEGQKNYELAESLRLTGQEGYVEKYEEALKSEDQNVKVLLGLTAGYHMKKKCELARAQIETGFKINPNSQDLKLSLIKNSLCSGKVWSDEELMQLQSLRDHIYYKMALVEIAFKNERLDDAQQSLREALSLDKSFPQVNYWEWKLNQLDTDRGRLAAQEYARVCKTLAPAMKRKYYFEPNLCIDLDLVEEYLKKTEGSEK